ncbi:restriction endonuclease subunit S [Rubellimicrobium sp. CFH 75288]|uniref:restriction endonuclease subunit S n=1 Tax=Rubellimicrobium sp. CFH 75288 TaxID=2697034 RepID=UPI0014133493|nr:restriction endonuclease subunit S [Rubellimicrobium sp. CFH 75288]
MGNLEFQATDWIEIALGDACTFRGGSGFSEAHQGHRSGDHPFIKVSDLTIAGNEKYITTAQHWVSVAALRELRATLQPAGAVVFPKVGAALKLNRRRILLRPTAIDNNMMAAIPDRQKLDGEFLYYFLLTQDLGRFSQESAVPSVNQQHLSSIEISLPPLPEQRKIAAILRTWDEALERLAALRAAKARRLDGLRGRLIAAASRAGRPATFGDVLTESREPGTDGATARKISVRLYGKGAVEKDEPRGGSANTRYYRRRAGQIIWSKLDFLNGAFALIGPELDGLESTLDLPAFDCSEAVNPVWLIEYLTRPAYYTRQVHLARGQRKARRVSPEDWLASPLRLPDRQTQDRIAAALSAGREELALLDAEIDALTRQKRGLMQKLLTGAWRVMPEEPVA